MFLNKIQITNYAFSGSSFAFKKVDISFERDLCPLIFPLGGEQGCGKSTLLKLVYDKLTTDAVHFDDGLKLQVDDTDRGGVHLITQSEDDGILHSYGDDNSTTFKNLVFRKPPTKQGSLAQQRTESLLSYIADTKDSIILMDNPDMGLHPDHQYNLCRSIADLETGNQFIVATQSYEFCNALTPRHVKILENDPA